MKKILMGAIVLFLFAASISLVEISCKKADAQARPASPASNRTVLFARAASTINGTDTVYSGTNLFVCNIDGSNIRQIPIPLPAKSILGANAVGWTACLTPNADTVVFSAASSSSSSLISIYCCALDGTGLREIVQSIPGKLGMPFLYDVK